MEWSETAVRQKSRAKLVTFSCDISDSPADLLFDGSSLHIAGKNLYQSRHGGKHSLGLLEASCGDIRQAPVEHTTILPTLFISE